MIKAKRDLINACILLVFSVFAYYGSTMIPVRGMGKTEADFFPKLIIGLLVVLSLCLLVSSIWRMRKETSSGVNLSFKQLMIENKKVILTFVIFALYVFLLNMIGYFISSILFLMGMYLLLATHRKKLWLVGIGIITLTFILYFIFQEGLSVFLPSGRLF